MRERRQPPVSPRRSEIAGDFGAHCDGRRARPHHSPASDRECRPFIGRRAPRMDACARRTALVRFQHLDVSETVVARSFDEHKSVRLPCDGLNCDGNSVWTCAGAATSKGGCEQRDQERRSRSRRRNARAPPLEHARRS